MRDRFRAPHLLHGLLERAEETRAGWNPTGSDLLSDLRNMDYNVA